MHACWEGMVHDDAKLKCYSRLVCPSVHLYRKFLSRRGTNIWKQMGSSSVRWATGEGSACMHAHAGSTAMSRCWKRGLSWCNRLRDVVGVCMAGLWKLAVPRVHQDANAVTMKCSVARPPQADKTPCPRGELLQLAVIELYKALPA